VVAHAEADGGIGGDCQVGLHGEDAGAVTVCVFGFTRENVAD